MIEVFQGDDFTLEFENVEGNFEAGSFLCKIVTNKPTGDTSGIPPADVWEILTGTTNKISVNLSTGSRNPSKKYAPYKWFVRLTIKNSDNEQVTVFQEELYIKELY